MQIGCFGTNPCRKEKRKRSLAQTLVFQFVSKCWSIPGISPVLKLSLGYVPWETSTFSPWAQPRCWLWHWPAMGPTRRKSWEVDGSSHSILMVKITMLNGKINYFDWSIFNSYSSYVSHYQMVAVSRRSILCHGWHGLPVFRAKGASRGN